MPAQSVKERVAALQSNTEQKELRLLLGAIVDALQAVAAKLDADGGVTDTNYGATVAAIIVD